MSTYDEQRELRRYLWEQFPYLCTARELEVYKANLGKQKAVGAEPQGQAIFRRMFGDWERADVAAELALGFDRFTEQVLERITLEHGDLYFVHRCGQCGRIAGSPRACMCQWCGHEWYEHRERQDRIANRAIEQAKKALQQ
jgi:rRNA maturation endonuclease Nob1